MLEKYLSFLFIFSVPLQVRYFIYGSVSPSEAEKGEKFVEWSSAFVYFSDIVLFALLFVFLLDKNNRERFFAFDKIKYYFLVIAILSLVQLFGNIDVWSSFYRSLKLFELLLVFLWASSTRVSFNVFAYGFLGLGVIQSLIAIGQFVLQKSLGLSFLLESPLSPLNQDVARIMTGEGIFIRGYGLLPSPNILAFFIAVSILFLIYLFIKDKVNLYLFAVLAYILSFGLIITFARGVIGFSVMVAVALLAFLFYKEKDLRRSIVRCIVVFMLCGIFLGGLFSNIIYERFFVAIQYDNSVSERVESYYPVLQYPENLLSGVGGGNTIYYQEKVTQPIHNSFLLFSYEWSVFVGVMFLYILYLLFRKNLKNKKIESKFFISIIVLVFLIGNIDHFLVTIQQSLILLGMLLGIFNNSDYL